MVVPRRVAVPLIVAGILVPIGLAGCGSSYSSDGGGSNADRYDTTTLTAKAGSVTISMMNPSSTGMPHGIAVQGNGVDKDGPTVQPGGTSTVTVTLKPGTYTYYCPVSGHEAGGMKGILTVTA